MGEKLDLIIRGGSIVFRDEVRKLDIGVKKTAKLFNLASEFKEKQMKLLMQ